MVAVLNAHAKGMVLGEALKVPIERCLIRASVELLTEMLVHPQVHSLRHRLCHMADGNGRVRTVGF
jgi:hypothetical protein